MIEGFEPLTAGNIVKVHGATPSYTVPAGKVLYVHSFDGYTLYIDEVPVISSAYGSGMYHLVDKNRILYQFGYLSPIKDSPNSAAATQSGSAFASPSDVVVSPVDYLFAVKSGSTIRAGAGPGGATVSFWGELGSDVSAAVTPVVNVTVNSTGGTSSPAPSPSASSGASGSDSVASYSSVAQLITAPEWKPVWDAGVLSAGQWLVLALLYVLARRIF